MVRPLRQACHRKGSGANRFNRHDRYDRLNAGHMEKSHRERRANKRRTVYREVSFNATFIRQGRISVGLRKLARNLRSRHLVRHFLFEVLRWREPY